MKQRRIARKHLYDGGSCWPSNFGLVTSEPTLWSVFFMFEHERMPRTAVSYSAGCEISETPSFFAGPSPKMTRLFLSFVPQLNVNFPDCTFYRSLFFFLLCTFVLNCSTNTALYFESGSSWQICRDYLVTNCIRNSLLKEFRTCMH